MEEIKENEYIRTTQGTITRIENTDWRSKFMSEEEMKVIDLLKNIDKQKCIMLECPVVKNNIERQLKIIELNRIIRNQSKEIEELKFRKEESIHITKETVEFINSHYIHKDKIKAKIEIRKEEKENCKDSIEEKYLLREIYILQSLLEEE